MTCGKALLLTSELVTNVVRHTDSEIRVTVEPVPHAVAVHDGVAATEAFRELVASPPPTADASTVGGRGMGIVHTLADRVGLRRRPRRWQGHLVRARRPRHRRDVKAPSTNADTGSSLGPRRQVRADATTSPACLQRRELWMGRGVQQFLVLLLVLELGGIGWNRRTRADATAGHGLG